MKFFRSFASRYIRFFLLGLAVFVAVEGAGLIWLDKVYFRSDSHISVSRLSSDVSGRQKEPQATIPSGATDIQYSYDGGYLSYMLSDRLVVVDTEKGVQNTVPDVSGESMKIAQYAWVYGRNRIILAAQSTGGKSGNYIRFYYYVPTDTSELQEMDNNNQRVSIDLDRVKNLSSASAAVTDLDFSTVYSTVYAKVQDKNGRSLLYMLNIDNELDTVDTSTSTIGRIVTDQQDSGLLYEDSKSGYVYSWQPTAKGSTNKVITAGGTKKLRLLGVDGEDTIYLAPTAGDSTSTVLAGTAAGGWKTVSLGKETSLSRIHISLAGKIYVDEPEAQVLRNVTDSTQTAYNGTLVGLYNDGFFTADSDTLPSSSAKSGTSSARSSSAAGGQITVTGQAFGTDALTGAASRPASSAASAARSSKTASSSK